MCFPEIWRTTSGHKVRSKHFSKVSPALTFGRSRNVTISPLVEKGLPSAKASTKQSSLEALLLYVELDKADPILDDLLAGLSNKQPKIVASTLHALAALYHAYGVKVVEPKPALKSLPKVFGHADKNVRAEASNLAVELYRWLREAMKPLFWEELKPVQQQDLEKLFEKVKAEGPAKQDRLQRSQQAAAAKQAAAAQTQDPEEEEGAEEEAEEIGAFDLAEPVDVLAKIPESFQENTASTKWKDRKDALDALYEAANTPKIKDGHFDEVVAVLAKSMKDANVQVVTTAANCIDVLAKGLQRGFAKYRSRIMPSIMERLKDKKLADPLGQALDSVASSSSLSDCLDDILEFLKHKNPQVKAETLKFLIRSLRNTRDAPTKEETKSIAGAATKLLTESVEATRNGGAEVLGTLMKIMGERAMNPYMENVDNIRKDKIKEYHDAAIVKAKDKPKPAPPPAKAAPAAQKRPAPGATKKGPSGMKPPAKRVSTPTSDKPAASPTKPAAGKSIPSKLGQLGKPGGIPGPKSRLPGAGPAPKLTSPRRTITPHSEDESTAPATSKLGRGLAGRPLGKPSTGTPAAAAPTSPPSRTNTSALSAAELAELDTLRSERERLTRATEDLRTEKQRLTSQIHELQNQNAQLIEDHTRDVLSIKAKETQLVRARSDAEAAEASVARLGRDNERLKRELGRAVRGSSAGSPLGEEGGVGVFRDSGSSAGNNGVRPSFERVESARSGVNGGGGGGVGLGMRGAGAGGGGGGVVVGSPSEEKENKDLANGGGGKEGGGEGGGKGPENWKRAAEVTSQLKARIEQMKVS